MQTGVLLLIYNRPELTRRTVARLVELGVSEIYVSADGPKGDTDRQRCDAARACVSVSGLNVHRNFSETNRGCREGVMHGLDWFFQHVEEGIVLEDDCLPTAAFMRFATDMLERYRQDTNVYMISGCNPLGQWETGHSHHFIRIGHIWGWATWKDRWQDFDPKLPKLNTFCEKRGLQRLFGNTDIPAHFEGKVRITLSGAIETWDYQWTMHHLMQGKLAAIPSLNMVENIGFGPQATHTDERPDWLCTEVWDSPKEATEPLTVSDREFEMTLHMARKRNEAGLRSSHHFSTAGARPERPLSIVQINTTDEGGGAEAIAMMHHRALLEKGHRAHLLVADRKTPEHGVGELKGDILTQIRSFNPDVIHVHNLHDTGISLGQLAELADSIPVLWTLHDEWLLSGSERHPFRTDADDLSFLDRERWNHVLAEKKRLAHHSSIRFTGPSQWLRDCMLHTHGIATHFVPNRCVETMALPTPERERPYLLYVANHADRNPRKDLATLRRAWEQVALDTALDLVCIGGTPAQTMHGNGLYQMLERQPSEAVLAWMKGACAVVQASRQENAPLTILEAHRVGTPVIGAMVGGIPEMVCPEEAELLYPMSDADALATSIIRALEKNVELREAVRNRFVNGNGPMDMTDVYIGHYIDRIHG
jgi:glycosyltransferase involved in cell wall biosynthesis